MSAGIDVVHYNAAVSGCGTGGSGSACEKGQQWQLALGLLGEMAFVKVDKDVIT